MVICDLQILDLPVTFHPSSALPESLLPAPLRDCVIAPSQCPGSAPKTPSWHGRLDIVMFLRGSYQLDMNLGTLSKTRKSLGGPVCHTSGCVGLMDGCPTNSKLRTAAAGLGVWTGLENRKLCSMVAPMGRAGWEVPRRSGHAECSGEMSPSQGLERAMRVHCRP